MRPHLPTTSDRQIARLGLALLVALAIPRDVSAQEEEFRPAPLFEGTRLPDPPRQKEPWTPPETRLPRFLVAATATLFDQGLADPRGCEYRSIEITAGSVWGGQGGIVSTKGWVLPAPDGEKQRFAVAWSGLVYPVVKLGEPADLAADVLALGDAAGDGRADVAPKARRQGGMRAFSGFGAYGANNEGSAVNLTSLHPIRVCLLLRLGRADLAEALWAAGSGRPREADPAKPRPKVDLTNYGISYLSLAVDLTWFHFDRAVCAHMRGDDAIALADARLLTSLQKAVEARAEGLGFPHPQRFDGKDQPTPYIDFLGQLPELLADQERRAKEPKRPAVPPRGGDKSARIAALIRDLDQAVARQWGQPGGVSLGEASAVKTLIAEGDDAVEPLIEALRHDTRLTRSVHFWRDFSRNRTILGTHEAVYTALSGILKTSFFGAASTGDNLSARGNKGREAVAAQVQAYWEKYKAVPLVERWYKILADDRSGPSGWLQAAGNIVQPGNVSIVPGSTAFVQTTTTPLKPGELPRLRGESLREGHEPTVAALMSRRVDSLLKSPSRQNFSMDEACSMARMLATWDASAAQPKLREISKIALEQYDPANGNNNTSLAFAIAGFTLDRVRAGDPDAAREYAGWVRLIGPDQHQHQILPILEPLYRLTDDPAIAESAEWLFNNPKSPWVPLIAKGKPGSSYQIAELITSPLVCIPAFRKMLLASLEDRSPAGSATLDEGGGLQIQMDAGWSSGLGQSKVDPLAPKAGVKVPFRMADYYAWELSGLEGSPAFELYWPEPRRNQGLAEMAAFLKKRGDRFIADDPIKNDIHGDFPHKRAHLSFPQLDHPATREEVEKGTAIFSLEGEGERRVVPLMDRPLKAKWVTFKDFPYIQQPVDPQVGPQTEYDQSGRVWQAEEVQKDGRWRRYFGFVGGQVIAKVPAEEIEFTDWPYGGWWRLSDGLDAAFFGPAFPEDRGPGDNLGHEPGSSLRMTLHLRNRAGFDRQVPTAYVLKEGGRVVSLRRGIELSLERAPLDANRVGTRTGRADDRKWEAIPAKSAARFDPDASTRTLRPAESMIAFELDLLDVFDASKPGNYRLRLALSKESGVAEGTFHEVTFQVGDVKPPVIKDGVGDSSFE
jgi:hypothetical protein